MPALVNPAFALLHNVVSEEVQVKSILNGTVVLSNALLLGLVDEMGFVEAGKEVKK